MFENWTLDGLKREIKSLETKITNITRKMYTNDDDLTLFEIRAYLQSELTQVKTELLKRQGDK